MPRLIGPLYSLQASGTIAGQLTFMVDGKHTVARFNSRKQLKVSTAQALHKARVVDCFAAWRNLSPTEKQAWNDTAVWKHQPGNATFFQEWFAQNIYPPDIPNVPI